MKSKGFTLIELLVVVAIISLLSSVVLASVKDARERAQVRSFRTEINQMITALELYKNTYGTYPYEATATPGGSIYNYHKLNNNTESVTSGPALGTILSSFLAEVPNIPNPTNSSSPAYGIRTNVGSGTRYRCDGDTVTPPYVILIYQNNPLLYAGFSDWPTSEYSNSPFTTWSDTSSTRCFSLQ